MKYVFQMMVCFSALLLFGGFPSRLCYGNDENRVKGSQAPASNPLIEEMRTLDSAFRDIVSAVAIDDTVKVQAALQSLTDAMEKTYQGIHQIAPDQAPIPKHTPSRTPHQGCRGL